MYDHPLLHLLSQQSNVRHFIHHPLFICLNCQMYDTSSTIPLSIYYPNSQMYDTIHHPPVHLLSQQSNVRRFIHHAPSSTTIPIVKCTTIRPPSLMFINYPNSQMYDASSTMPPLHLSQQSNVRQFIHHPPVIYYPNSQIYDTSSTIPLFICYPNSQLYDTSSTIPPSSTIPIVKCTTLHPPPHCSSTIPIVKCTTPHPPYPPSSTIPIVKCTTLHPPSPLFTYLNSSGLIYSSSTIPIVKCTTLHPPSPLFIYYPNSQMYDASSTMPPLNISKQSNVRHFIHHPPSSSTIPIVKCTTIHPPSPCSSTIPIVKCTTLHPPCRLFNYYLNSQMYDTSSTIPPVHLLSQQSNVRHFIHHPPCSSTIPIGKCTLHPIRPSSSLIPIVKCTTLHPPSPVHLSQLSNVRHFIHHTPLHLLSQQSNVRHYPPSPCSSTIPIVKCTTLHPPCPLFNYYPNSQMYDYSSTIPHVHQLSQQANVHFIQYPLLHLLSQQSNVRHFIHHPLFICLNCQMYDTSSTIPLSIYYPNSQMYDTIHHPPVHLLSQQSNVRRFIHHAPSSTTIPIVKCTTIRPPYLMFINYPNSQMYDASSTMPPLHLSQQSNVRQFIHHPPVIYYPNSQIYDTSSTIPLFICYPNSQLYDTSSTIPPSSTIPIVKCTTLHPPPPLFIYYPNSQMYDTSSTIPPVHLLSQQANVHFIQYPLLHLLSQQSNVRHFIHHPLFICLNCQMYDTSSTIPLSIYYPNSQMYDTIHHPPVHLLSQQSNVRHFIHHPPCSSTIPIGKCTTLHPPSPLFIYYPNRQMYTSSNTPFFISYPNSQMYDTSSTIPCSSVSIVKCTTLHPPYPSPSTIPIVKCTTLSTIPLFIYYPNSQMYDASSTMPPLQLLSQQSNVRLFVHHPSCSSTIPIVKCTTLHPPCPLFIYLNSQMYDNSSTIPL